MKKRVLVAEDDAGMLALLCYRLEHEGYEVLAVTDGESALRVISEEHPDVSLLDRGIPGLDGAEVLQRVRSDQRTARARVVILSGHDPDGDGIADLFPDAYLQKPVEPEDVLACVAGQILESGRSEASTQDLFNLDTVRSWLGDEELVRAHVRRFLVNCDEQTRSLVAAAEGGNVAECAVIAHRLAGALANLGATQARDRLRALEHAARSDAVGGVDEAVWAIRRATRALHEWVEEADDE